MTSLFSLAGCEPDRPTLCVDGRAFNSKRWPMVSSCYSCEHQALRDGGAPRTEHQATSTGGRRGTKALAWANRPGRSGSHGDFRRRERNARRLGSYAQLGAGSASHAVKLRGCGIEALVRPGRPGIFTAELHELQRELSARRSIAQTPGQPRSDTIGRGTSFQETGLHAVQIWNRRPLPLRLHVSQTCRDRERIVFLAANMA